MSEAHEIARGIAYITTLAVNVFFVGEPGRPWTLVDTGLPGFLHQVREAAEERYGADARPQAIILTHGHFDHVGNALELAEHWDVPIYAHPLEFPYLTGQSKYPPFDPTVGGFYPFLSRFFPKHSYDLRPRLQALPPIGRLPGMPGWRWLPTPGHSPGHISLFRGSDETLIAGDAFVTVNLDSFWGTVAQKPQVVRPPSYATSDWPSARRSVERLVALRPLLLATGHGPPMSGPEAAAQMQALADGFPTPAHGRYADEPARTDEHGIVSVPPPARDPFLTQLVVGVGVAALAGTTLAVIRRRRTKEKDA